MSSEHLVYDVEKGGKVTVVREKPSREGQWKCLSIFSFLLLMGAVAVFAVLQFGAFRQSAEQDAMEERRPFAGGLPQTMKVQALASRKPVAHVVAVSSDSDSVSNEIVWSENVAPAMLEKIVLDRQDNALVIPSDGLYFVYSQLMFHGTSCSSDKPVTHTIKTYSTIFNDKIGLLTSAKSVCDGEHKSKLWFESIYQGGVFKLTKGDRLWSQTESAEFLDLAGEGQNYFGVIALD